MWVKSVIDGVNRWNVTSLVVLRNSPTTVQARRDSQWKLVEGIVHVDDVMTQIFPVTFNSIVL